MPRVMEIVTPLGEDVLLFHRMSAREEMSRLFEYQLDLLSKEKEDDIHPDDILGKTGRKTGFWLEEGAAPYYVFKDAGVELTLASPKGGQPGAGSEFRRLSSVGYSIGSSTSSQPWMG